MEAVLPMRRKSYGSIRSPVVKRNIHSMVVLQGWLFKLEGAALKQWKHRWCVLSDFCLFFYKSPNEEKVYATVLLPSYTISPCVSDDHISRKYAFKAEHQNMKTYFFASDGMESMKTWMNAMSLASIMQNYARCGSGISSTTSIDEEDSGFTSYRSRRYADPNSTFEGSLGSDGLKQRSLSCGERVGESCSRNDRYSTGQANNQQYLYMSAINQAPARHRQPLYANAPPKPKRLTHPDQCVILRYEQYNNFPYTMDENSLQYKYPTPEVYVHPDSYMKFENHSTTRTFKNELNYEKPPQEIYQNMQMSENQCNLMSEMQERYERPKRPHSAEFLERGNSQYDVQVPKSQSCVMQTQRPKSSLEYYDRFEDQDECDMEVYRHAIRMQAENLYTNKSKPRQTIPHDHVNSTKISSSYVYPTSHVSNQYQNNQVTNYHDHIENKNIDVISPNRKQVQEIPQTYKKNANHKESMIRLMEWKQRMLQSPLSRRNNAKYSSSSSDASSPRRQPLRPPLPPEYNTQMNKLDSPNIQYRICDNLQRPNNFNQYGDSEYPQMNAKRSNLTRSANRELFQADYNDSHDTKYLENNISYCRPMPSFEETSPRVSSSNDAEVMYCVDAENNKLLVYGDQYASDVAKEYPNSKTFVDKRFQQPNETKTEYVAKTSLSEVSQNQYPISEKFAAVQPQPHISQDAHKKGSVVRQRYESSSSDETETGESMKPELKTREMITSVEMHDDAHSTSIADYVNIRFAQNAFQTPDDSPQNRGPKENVEKNPQQLGVKGTKRAEKMLDMNRDDYYKASKLFYTSSVQKNEVASMPVKNMPHVKVQEKSIKHTKGGIAEIYEKKEIFKIAHSQTLDIDKDVGLPIPLNSVKSTALNHQNDQKLAEMSSINRLLSEEKSPDRQAESSLNAKKHMNFEELRTQLQRKREAPPANIVQDRIRKFESVENNSELTVQNVQKTSSIEINGSRRGLRGEKCSRKKSKQKFLLQSKIHKHGLHSDTEAIRVQDSDGSLSDDSLTMKSAPILLSPLSSVLADLRKTADSGKEKSQENSKSENRASGTNLNKHNLEEQVFINSQFASGMEPIKQSTSYEPEEEAYLSMSGLKCFRESEYVAMDDSKGDSSPVRMTKSTSFEEPLYNEPCLPPHSYLHDGYGNPIRNGQIESDSSSSDESSSGHIYEKPCHAISLPDCSTYNSFPCIQRPNQSHKPGTNHYSIAQCMFLPITAENKEQSCKITPRNEELKTMCQSAERLNLRPLVEPAPQNHSVPDLLQLQEVKDTDASDADDEASRDFDVPFNMNPPSYELVSSSQCRDDNPRYVGFPLFELKKLPEQNVLPKSKKQTECNISLPSMCFPELKENGHKNVNLPSQTEGKDDEARKCHLRKFRVYTKGTKPESPKIYPVPFNFEEVNMPARNKSSDAQNFKTDLPTNSQQKSARLSSLDSTSDMSQIEHCRNMHDENILPHIKSLGFAPDVVPYDRTERKGNNQRAPIMELSPNSAPYYYSDLLLEGHFTQGAHILRRNEFSDAHSFSPKNSQMLLNNVTCKSPGYCSKGDIGRKVNKINSKAGAQDDKAASNQKADPSCSKLSQIENLDHSFDAFYCSQSKYLDAERNKYEAGHTLEKTRRIDSTLQYFKQRSASPNLKSSDQKRCEPVYENFSPNAGNILQRRLSCSLEGIPKAIEAPGYVGEDSNIYATVDDLRSVDSPVYENISLFHQCVKSGSLPTHSSLPYMPSECSEEHRRTSNVFKTNNHSSNTNKLRSRQPNKNPKQIMDMNADQDVLNQNELRRVSEQHFFRRHMKEKIAYKKKFERAGEPNIVHKSTVSSNNQHKNPENTMSHEIPRKTNANYSAAKENINLRKNQTLSDAIIDDDSSFSSSSCDEDVQMRPKLGSPKSKSSFNRTRNASDSEIHIHEKTSPLKKLMQFSEGVMNKGKRLSISAGDLLGKTHEELVLLLIQLRRNQTRIARAKEKCCFQIKNMENCSEIDENMQEVYAHNFSDLMQQVSLLDKQYENTRPLVNLVDNMVKLGSLYGTSDIRSFSYPHLAPPDLNTSLDQIISDQFPLIMSSSEEKELQAHLNEIYSLDHGLSQETHSYTSLQQDKEMLEHTLHGMRSKILDHQDEPIELQKLRKQQRLIEKELVRVKRLLSQSAKKIEDATTKNDQLEQEILLLRKKLQQALSTGSYEMKTSQSRADLEAELTRVQTVLEELANHRQEISNTVETLKNDTHARLACSSKVRASPTGVAGSAPLPLRKKQQSTYLETDLDTMETFDLSNVCRDIDDIPVYANAEEIIYPCYENVDIETQSENYSMKCNVEQESSSQLSLQDISDADDKMKRFYGILPKEKPCEIKTVRIVKRQSERRNRERGHRRVSYDDHTSVWIDEPDFSSDDLLETDDETFKNGVSSIYPVLTLLKEKQPGSAHERLFGNPCSTNEQSEHSSSTVNSPLKVKSVKRTKRRHYTVSGCENLTDPQLSKYFRERPRSRDDVDMERCLRTANTPDIVKSTLKKNEVFDDQIIDRELGLPEKINIPERYVEDEPENLSASEKLRRSLKAENIRKMLSQTTANYENVVENSKTPPDTVHKKCSEQKRNRAHLLSLNHALAQEAMERSKAVAANIYCHDSQSSS